MIFHDANTAIFTRAEAKALAAFASADETRLHLNAVLVDFATGAAVTTDGHRLAKSNSAACFDGAEPCLIPLDAWMRAIKACSKKTHGILVQRAGAAVTLTAIDPGHCPLRMFGSEDGPTAEALPQWALGAVQANLRTVQFPPYEQVIPSADAQNAETWKGYGDTAGTHPRTKTIGVNARYVGDCALVAIAAGNETGGVELHLPPGPLDPIVGKCEGPEGSWTVVVMPMRI